MRKERMKKIVAVLLSVMLVIGMVPAEAFAAGEGAVMSTTNGQWIYSPKNRTLTQGRVVIKDVRLTGKNSLAIKPDWDRAPSIDSSFSGKLNLTGVIKDKSGKKYRLTEIGPDAFTHCEKMTEVKLPEGITSIESYAFSGCKSLNSIEIPQNVESIGNSAFGECDNLKYVKLPAGVREIGEHAFYYCEKLESIKFPYGIQEIGMAAFLGCKNLKEINLPESLKKLGWSVFAECEQIKKIRWPKSMSEVPFSTFSRCTNLEEVILPEGVKKLGYHAFGNCDSLQEINFPESLELIGSGAFVDCVNIKKMDIPENVSSIEGYAFTGCSSLEAVSLPSGMEKMEECVFMDCTDLKEIKFPDKLKNIGGSAMLGCTNLEEVALPETMNAIGVNEFYKCSSLKKITIPAGVKKIGEGTFSGCSNLSEIIMLASTPSQIKSDTLSECYALNTIYVPSASVEKYKRAPVWSRYSNIIKGYDEEGESSVYEKPEKAEIRRILSDFGRIKLYCNKIDTDPASMSFYQVEYWKSGSDDRYSAVSLINKDNTVVVDSLDRNIKYNLRARVYIRTENGERIYGDWSDIKTIYTNRLGSTGQIMPNTAITKLKADKRTISVNLKKVVFTKEPVKITYQIAYKEDYAAGYRYVYTTDTYKVLRNLEKNCTYMVKVRYYYKSKVDGRLVFSPYSSVKKIKI